MSYLLVITLLLVVINLLNYKKNHFILKMIFSLLNLFNSILYFILRYFDVIKMWDIISIVFLIYIHLVFIIYIIIYLYRYYKETTFTQEYLKNFSTDVFYYVLTKKNRIKDYNDNILFCSKSSLINKNFYTLLSRNYRAVKKDDISCDNNTLLYNSFAYFNNPTKQSHKIMLENTRLELVTFDYTILPIRVFNKISYKMIIGSVHKKSDNNRQSSSSSEEFFFLLDNAKQGVYIINLQESEIFINECLKTSLGESRNTMRLEDFYSKFSNADLIAYKHGMNKITRDNPYYDFTYKIKVNGQMLFFKDKGQRIYDDYSSNTLIGYLDRREGFYYEPTTFQLLDNLSGLDAFMLYINVLIKKQEFFQAALIRFNNIASINEKYSREVGNMVISDFLSNMDKNLSSENSRMFRLQGLDFMYIVTDMRKTETLRVLLTTNAIIKPITYTSLKLDVDVNLAVTDGIYKDPKKILEECYMAIQYAIENKKSHVYFKDLK